MNEDSTDRPTSIEQYRKWLKEAHGVTVDRRTRSYYESVALKLENTFRESALWIDLCSGLAARNQEYYAKTGYYLLMEPDAEPKLSRKPYDSFLLKTFRKNILENQIFPNPPSGGWLLPDSWFSSINDIVRTTLIVKYLDGVKFTCDNIEVICNGTGFQFDSSFEARDDGYYAAHIVVGTEAEIPKMDFDTVRISAHLEIQVTTQLQEVIRRLLHLYYEEKRKVRSADDGYKWQWDYEGDEFVANYLGHILHYVEGMIMDVRARGSSDTKGVQS